MKNENGYGGISYMGAGRRRPYRVRITTGWAINPETGKAKQEYVTLGYFPSRKAAMIALAEYNKDPYDLNAEKITFEEVYQALQKTVLLEKGKTSLGQFNAAYKKCTPLYKMKMKDIKKKHMQDILDEYGHMSETTQVNIKTVFKTVFTFCMENDLVKKDYSQYVKIKGKESEQIHVPFTVEEVAKLWAGLDTPVRLNLGRYNFTMVYPADTVLMLIYTGMRPSELLNIRCEDINLAERYMIGGMKTEAGKERIIPLHDDIVPLVEKRLATGTEWLIPYKADRPAKLQQYYLRLFTPLMEALGMNHLPHDGRHTFATFADRFDIKPLRKKLIMGHKITDITDGVYTHKTAAELVEEVNKIVFWEK